MHLSNISSSYHWLIAKDTTLLFAHVLAREKQHRDTNNNPFQRGIPTNIIIRCVVLDKLAKEWWLMEVDNREEEEHGGGKEAASLRDRRFQEGMVETEILEISEYSNSAVPEMLPLLCPRSNRTPIGTQQQPRS